MNNNFDLISRNQHCVTLFGEVPTWSGPVLFVDGPGMILHRKWFGESDAHADQVGTEHRYPDLRMVGAIERHRVCRPVKINNRAYRLKLVYVLRTYGDDEQQKTKQDSK